MLLTIHGHVTASAMSHGHDVFRSKQGEVARQATSVRRTERSCQSTLALFCVKTSCCDLLKQMPREGKGSLKPPHLQQSLPPRLRGGAFGEVCRVIWEGSEYFSGPLKEKVRLREICAPPRHRGLV